MVDSALIQQNNARVNASSEQVGFQIVFVLHDGEIKTHYAPWISGGLNQLIQNCLDVVFQFFEIDFV